MRSFERKSLAPNWRLFGLDSVQGYLEIAEWYANGEVIFSCDIADRERFGSMYFQLLQLEQDGLVKAQWESGNSPDDRNIVKLRQIALTIAGQKLLAALRAKSRIGKLKERFITLFWAVVASIITTLVVLAIKGS